MGSPSGGRREKLAILIALILGLAVFAPMYSYLLWLAGRMGIDMAELARVWLSFDAGRFAAFAGRIAEQGHLRAFASIYYLNCVSVLGYLAVFYSLSRLIARAIDPASRLRAAAVAFPPLAIVIAALDLASNLVIIAALSDLSGMREWMMIVIGGSYAARVLLLYALFIWFAAAAVHIARGRVRKRRREAATSR